MLVRLFLLFTLVPLADLFLLLWISKQTSWPVTLALIFLPGILGAWLARREGLRCLREVREKLSLGELPGAALVDGLLVLLAGALLITPGLITDTAGFLLLIPPIRRAVRQRLRSRLRARFFPAASPDGRPSPPDETIIDVEASGPDDSR